MASSQCPECLRMVDPNGHEPTCKTGERDRKTFDWIKQHIPVMPDPFEAWGKGSR